MTAVNDEKEIPPIPELYARWFRADAPNATDDKVARVWRITLPEDREFWTALAARLDLYRTALERLADEGTPVLDSGLGGGPAEELHVRASYAAHALGRDVCGCSGCSECMVSLGLDDEEDEEGECECGSPTCRRVSHDEPASARDALDAQTLHDSPGADL